MSNEFDLNGFKEHCLKFFNSDKRIMVIENSKDEDKEIVREVFNEQEITFKEDHRSMVSDREFAVKCFVFNTSKGENMLNEINEKIVTAKKSGDKFTSNSLVMVKSELLNNQKTESPKDELDVVKSYVKRLNKSLEAFKGTAQYDDLVKEYDLVKALLPEGVTEDQVRLAVTKFVTENPGEKHMGKVMGAIKGQLKDVDGALLSKVVKEVLAN